MHGLLLLATISFGPKPSGPVGVWIGSVNTDHVQADKREQAKKASSQVHIQMTFKADHSYRTDAMINNTPQSNTGVWTISKSKITVTIKTANNKPVPAKSADYQLSKDGTTITRDLGNGAALVFKRKK